MRSPIAANGSAGMAMLVTQISPSVAALIWMASESTRFGKPSVLGLRPGEAEERHGLDLSLHDGSGYNL